MCATVERLSAETALCRRRQHRAPKAGAESDAGVRASSFLPSGPTPTPMSSSKNVMAGIVSGARHRSLVVAVVGAVLLSPVVSAAVSATPAAAATTVPPAGGYFKTLGPGSALPSDATCASRVHRSTWEPRPENETANNTVPVAVAVPGFTPSNGGTDQRARALADRTTGNFKGTTDEIVQWAACKWGFSDDSVRAQAVSESTWYQSTTSDMVGMQAYCQIGFVAPCPQSFGLLQIKATAWPGTFPSSRDSTAFNLDYALMARRVCYEGWTNWMYSYPGSNVAYRAGDLWGCVGNWYSGTWYGPGTQSYIDDVQANLVSKPWRTWADRSLSPAAAVTLSAPSSIAPGATLNIGWNAGTGASARDWISLFKAGAPNTAYGEWHYTGGAVSGTMSFTAPSTAGTYQLRYLVNDGYVSVATSDIIVG